MEKIRLTKKYEKYPEYKDSGVEWLGEIPKDWFFDKLAHNLLRNDGGVWGEDDPTENGKLVLRSTEISQQGLFNLDTAVTRKLSATEFNKGKLLEGDLLITKSSGSADHLGKTGLVTKEIEAMEVAFSNFMQRLRVNKNYNPKYIYYSLNNITGREQINYWGSTTSGLVNLNASIINRFVFAIPTISEQEKIVDYLDEITSYIDQIVERKEKLIELLREKRTAQIKDIIKSFDVKGKGYTKEKIKHVIKSVESGIWGENSLGNADDIKCLRVADFDYANLGFFNVETIRNNEKLSKRKILQYGDILVEKSGGGDKTPVGRAILFNSNEKMVCANFIDVVRVDGNKISPDFLVLYLSILYSERVNTKYIKQNTGIQNMDIKAYFGEIVSYPDLRVQKEIVDDIQKKMNLFDQTIKKVDKTIEFFKEFKASLISNTVTGKIKV